MNTYRANTHFEGWRRLLERDQGFLAAVRAEWGGSRARARFGLTVQGEPEPLYMPILELADNIQAGKITTAAAVVKASKVIAQFTTRDIGTLEQRIAKARRWRGRRRG